MPTLNQAGFIAESVYSVMTQGVEGLELVVADGGSTDGTQAALAALAASYGGRLRWESVPDSGPAQAVNRAVSLATGHVIGWLNSDDLYEPGAIQRALDHLAKAPADVMVYGHATHVDADGVALAPYPTRAPDTPLGEFANGCFICQPSVFVRRAVWLAAGGLDETLRTAFDFDLWLKLFKAHPGRIGFMPAFQARSRLHEGSITLRQRERVALEGMAVVHRHLGPAPPGWLLTHFAERCATHPFDSPPADLRADLARLADAARSFVSEDGERVLRQRLAEDRALRLATRHLFVPVHPDGWAPPVLELRLRQPAAPCAALRLRGRHARPGGGPLRLSAQAPDGTVQRIQVPRNGPFELLLPVADRRSDARLVFRITSEDSFVPAQLERGSTDTRRLAYLVDEVELLPAA